MFCCVWVWYCFCLIPLVDILLFFVCEVHLYYFGFVEFKTLFGIIFKKKKYSEISSNNQNDFQNISSSYPFNFYTNPYIYKSMKYALMDTRYIFSQPFTLIFCHRVFLFVRSITMIIKVLRLCHFFFLPQLHNRSGWSDLLVSVV